MLDLSCNLVVFYMHVYMNRCTDISGLWMTVFAVLCIFKFFSAEQYFFTKFSGCFKFFFTVTKALHSI